MATTPSTPATCRARTPLGIEILREQVVRVRRPDAAWLRGVLAGRYSYDELMALVLCNMDLEEPNVIGDWVMKVLRGKR